jgi:hypothetical protein
VIVEKRKGVSMEGLEKHILCASGRRGVCSGSVMQRRDETLPRALGFLGRRLAFAAAALGLAAGLALVSRDPAPPARATARIGADPASAPPGPASDELG